MKMKYFAMYMLGCACGFIFGQAPVSEGTFWVVASSVLVIGVVWSAIAGGKPTVHQTTNQGQNG